MKKNCPEIQPAVIWLTGLSSAGKTTIANCLKERFNQISAIGIILDGDDIRNRLKVHNYDEESRKKHNLYVAYLASVLEEQGYIVIVSLISPYEETRREARGICKHFIEVYVSTDLETCMQRDTKGLYKKAISGEIKEFTGISSPYFPPVAPEIIVNNGLLTAEQCAEQIFNYCLGA